MRLFSDEFETGDLTAWTTVYGAAITDVTLYRGTYGITTPGVASAEYLAKSLAAAKTSGTLFLRFMLNIGLLGTADERLTRDINTNSTLEGFRLTLRGTAAGNPRRLLLSNIVTSTEVEGSFTLVEGIWYRVEIRHALSETVGQIEGRLYVGDGTTPLDVWGIGLFSGGNGTNENTLNTNVQVFRIGKQSGSTGSRFYYDCVALNDDTGSADNTWPGPSTGIPYNITLPAITGSAAVGQQLDVSDGTWGESPSSYAYQWGQCDETGESFAAISGATAAAYVVTGEDESHYLTCQVTATNGNGSSGPAQATAVGPVGVIATDDYGGYSTLPVSTITAGTAGYFRVGMLGNRMVLVTPDDKAFWMRAIYNTSGDIGLTFPGKYTDKYEWGRQLVRRAKTWGFNAIGEYWYNKALPVPTNKQAYVNPYQMPFVRLISSSGHSLSNRWGWASQPAHDLVSSTSASIYTGYRGGVLADFFAPQFKDTVHGIAYETLHVAAAESDPNWIAQGSSNWGAYFRAPGDVEYLETCKWLIGTSIDEADNTYGFKNPSATHPTYFVATCNPSVSAATVKGAARTYADPLVYSKLAWKGFLASRYGTASALAETVTTVGTAATFSGDHGLSVGDYIEVTPGGTFTPATQTRRVAATPTSSTATLEWAFTTDVTTAAVNQITNASSVSGLNAAWGSNYTTMESDGGWASSGTPGTGLMDENGYQTDREWMATSGGSGFAQAVHAEVNAAWDDYLEYQFAAHYFHVSATEVRGYTPNHLVFSICPFHNGRPPINRAANGRLDVYQGFIDRTLLQTDLESWLDTIAPDWQGPIYLWMTATAQEDSPLAGHANTWGEYNAATQAARGALYASTIERLLDYTSLGTHPIVGIDWWEWVDKVGANGEYTNFGLVTRSRDNAYDGVEAVMAAGTDQWGYATGGEAANYGDALTAITAAHAAILPALTTDVPPRLFYLTAGGLVYCLERT